MKKGIIIQASARSNGNTSMIVQLLSEKTQFEVIDLTKYSIAHFDYEFKNKGDDFKPLFTKIVNEYDVIIFATPIYWYTMSGLLKVFLDRITDFLFNEKSVARKLKGKEMMVLSCGNSKEIDKSFTIPFSQTAKYLEMVYKGHLHTYIEKQTISEDVKDKINTFVKNNI